MDSNFCHCPLTLLGGGVCVYVCVPNPTVKFPSCFGTHSSDSPAANYMVVWALHIGIYGMKQICPSGKRTVIM